MASLIDDLLALSRLARSPMRRERCDLSAMVRRALAELRERESQVDVLINNAGVGWGASIDDFPEVGWDKVFDTNVKGLFFLTQQMLPLLEAGATSDDPSRVINIGSIAGTYPYPGGNVYGATKAFVKQFSLNLRADLAGTAVRVTNVEPGLCGGTEFSNVRFHGDDAKAATVYQGVQAILPEDIANTVLWISEQPAHVNINSIEIMPVAQTFGPLQISRR